MNPRPAAVRALCSRSVPKQAQRKFPVRTFTNARPRWAASNFSMPAMSPTMTEGNITRWAVKEGDSFSAGDVILEIETDKAQMDVEAQEDGIMAKIMQPDGAKAVKVGSRIAVFAEQGDDISSIEIPAEDTASASKPQQEKPAESQQSSQASSTSSSAPSAPPTSDKSDLHTASTPSSTQTKQYPLYPSVQHLLHTNGLSDTDASKITATGPNGRLLKGDVLSYLGQIDKSYSAQQSDRIAKLGHLDLSNIKVAPPKAAAPPKVEKKEATIEETELDTEIAVPISLEAVYEAQTRLEDSLGMSLPLSTFIARASEIANQRLPRAKAAPTADELFNSVLGLDKVPKFSRGHYVPDITAIAPMPEASGRSRPARPKKSKDVYDILSGTGTAVGHRTGARALSGAANMASTQTTNVFSLSVKKGEEKRARVYLERIKTILEKEPGTCVL